MRGLRTMARAKAGSRRTRVRELAHRKGGDIDVTLLWRKGDDALTVILVEVASGTRFELSVRPEEALDVFHHPYAYLPSHAVYAEQESPAAAAA
jgi:hypothetical protein